MRDKMLANQHLDETLIDQGPVTEGWALVVPDYFEKYNHLGFYDKIDTSKLLFF